MLPDEESRRIMRNVAAKPGIHVNELIRSTGVVQNSFYPRLEKLMKAGLIGEKKVLNRRQFHVTKKGYRAILDDGAAQRKDFESVLRETKLGSYMLTRIETDRATIARIYSDLQSAIRELDRPRAEQNPIDSVAEELIKRLTKARDSYKAGKLDHEALGAVCDIVEPIAELLKQLKKTLRLASSTHEVQR